MILLKVRVRGEDIYIAPEQIQTIESSVQQGKTMLTFNDGAEGYVTVDEHIDSFLQRLVDAKIAEVHK